MKEVFIVGASDVIELVQAAIDPDAVRVGGYFALEAGDRSLHQRYEFLGADVVQAGERFEQADYVVAVYDNARRRVMQDELLAAGRNVISLSHPAAVVYPSAEMASGCLVAPNATVSSMATLGRGVYVNYGVLVGHDVTVGEFTMISPSAQVLGQASVGADCLIGAGVIILPGVSVGDNVSISAGTIVTRNVPSGALVMSQQKARTMIKDN